MTQQSVLSTKNLRLKKVSAATALSLIISISAFSASAQEKKDATKLPTVVVKDKKEKETQGYQSGTTNIGKMTQAAKDVPQSLTIVNRNLMDDRNADSLKEALRNVAGLTFNAGEGGRIGDNITIRGFTAASDLYLDGMRDNAQYNRETFNLERVEVLRGAASMIFGRGSTGGLINQVSKEADLDLNSQVNVTAGSHNYFRETADLNQNISDTAAIRLNLMKTDSESNRDFVTRDSFGVAPSVKFGIGTKNEFLLAYSHLEYDDTPDFGIPIINASGQKPINVPFDTFYGLAVDYQKDKADTYTGRWTHKFDEDSQLKTTLRRVEVERDLRATNPSYSSGSTTVNRGRQARGANEETTTLQMDYTNKFDLLSMKHDALVGAEYLYETAYRWSYFGSNTNTGGTISNPTSGIYSANPYDTLPSNYGSTYKRVNPQNFRDTNLGLYVQDMIEFLPHWKLLVGGRYDDFDAHYKQVADYPNANFASSNYNRRDRVFSYRSGLLHQPNDYSTYYVTYGTAFNPSGDLYAAESAATNAKSENTDPEKSINMEVGGKWELFDGDLSLRTAIFRSEKTNERNTDAATPEVYLLSGRRHTDGVEFEVSGRITKNWEVFSGIAFMKSEIDKHINPYAVGLTPPNTPTVSGNIWNTYRFNPNWRIGGGVDFVGERKGYSVATPTTVGAPYVAPNIRRIPGYARFDAMVEWNNKQYSAKLNVFNLLDKEYFDSIYPNGGWGVPGVDRSAQLTLGYKF